MCVRVACAVCDNRQQMRAHLGYADASDAEWLEYKSALCFDGPSSALRNTARSNVPHTA